MRDPARPLRTPKKREALPDVLTMARARAPARCALARDEIWERHFHGKPERDRLLLGAHGLRRPAPRVSLLGLDWDDVDLSRRLLRRAQGEGRPAADRSRSIRRSCRSSPTTTRRAVPLVEQALFVGVQGKPLNYTQLGQVFRHYVDAAGVGERKRVTPHTLRHVFASELLRAGANLRQVQELLGHKHLDSTQRYTRVTAHELRGAVKRLRWVG